MARRRKIVAPSAKDLEGIEAEFRRETQIRPGAATAPISQVAADAAQAHSVATTEERAEAARNSKDAVAHRTAIEQGRVIDHIGLDQIDDLALVRDRTVIDPDDMAELKNSIAAHGLRLPVEIFRTDGGNAPFGLISGYRRINAIRELYLLTKDEKYASINAIIRDPETIGGTISAMVEENEIRASLSHYERGRIAVIAAQQGVFTSTGAAVDKLFSAGSKAKRSKIRSFALIFEELGDMLEFPEGLREKDGLRMATALRAGADSRFREVLLSAHAGNAKEEWTQLEAVVQEYEAEALPGGKGGRPRTKAPTPNWQSSDTLYLSNGITLQRGTDSQGHVIRLRGEALKSDIMTLVMEELRRLLER